MKENCGFECSFNFKGKCINLDKELCDIDCSQCDGFIDCRYCKHSDLVCAACDK